MVGPLNPIPPHCPHLAAVPETGADGAEVGLTGHAFLVEDGAGAVGALVVVTTGAAED